MTQKNLAHILSFTMALIAVLSFAGCVSVPNLSDHKQDVIRYHDSGQYEAEITTVDKAALHYIEKRAASGEKNLAIILDIDETSLSGWDRLVNLDFGKDKERFIEWVNAADAPAIPHTLDLYRAAKRLGVKVFFITGRREDLAQATAKNLEKARFLDFDGLICRPASDMDKSMVPFKAGARRKLQEKGITIIANIGDQGSDLQGGYAEKNFKLPNPFYFTP